MGLIFVVQDFQFTVSALLQHTAAARVIDNLVSSSQKHLDRESEIGNARVDITVESVTFEKESRRRILQSQWVFLNELKVARRGGEHLGLNWNRYRFEWLRLGKQQNF